MSKLPRVLCSPRLLFAGSVVGVAVDEREKKRGRRYFMAEAGEGHGVDFGCVWSIFGCRSRCGVRCPAQSKQLVTHDLDDFFPVQKFRATFVMPKQAVDLRACSCCCSRPLPPSPQSFTSCTGLHFCGSDGEGISIDDALLLFCFGLRGVFYARVRVLSLLVVLSAALTKIRMTSKKP